MIIRTPQKYFEVKFGLKGLSLLAQNLNLCEELNTEFILYCGLISQHPDITNEEIALVKTAVDEGNLMPGIMSAIPLPFTSFSKIGGLYTKAVGEMGIAPADFFKMTPKEVEDAYEGYLTRKEMEANLTKLAVGQALKNIKDPIYLKEDKGYRGGSIKERQEIFNKLGIIEV
jgi:hypothetical protein